MLIAYLLIIALIGIDQLTKFITLIVSNGVEKPLGIFIKGVLEFEYLKNTGASFGMLQDQQFLFGIITIFSLVLFGYLFFDVNLKSKKVYSLAIIFIIAGTFGNAIDRLYRGFVIDMLSMPILNSFLDIFKISDFIFNIADLYMTLGIILFIIDVIFLESKREDKHEKNKEYITIE